MTALPSSITLQLEANRLRRPVLRSAVRSLQLPPGSRGLDVGAGAGLQALLLADAVGRDGHVFGVDLDGDAVAFARDLARGDGRSEQLTFVQGDMRSLPFPDATFDWVWSADCVGYPLGDLAPIVGELARVLKPGGRLALLGWSSQVVLPGHQALEASLNATCSAYLPFLDGREPALHFLRSLRWLRAVGLDQVRARTFVGEAQAPLDGAERAALTSLFQMLWTEPAAGASTEESVRAWQESRSLCLPGSPSFILDDPGYYAFFTYTMFSGRRPSTAPGVPG